MISNYNGEEILNTLTNKILNHGYVLSTNEAIAIVMLPSMFQENQDKILEKACLLLKEVKLKYRSFKIELIFEMECTIHKYAKTDEDIIRLEEVIGMQTIEGMNNYSDNWHLDEFYNRGFSRGLEERTSDDYVDGFVKGYFYCVLLWL